MSSIAPIRTHSNLRKRNGTQDYDYWSMCDTPIVSRSISRASESGDIFAPEGPRGPAGRVADDLARVTVLLRHLRLLEYVRARRYATKGRNGLGLHGTTLAALRSIGFWRDSINGLTGASCGPDLVGPGRLSGQRHPPALGGFSSKFPPAHSWDGYPGKVIRHSTRRATRPFGGAGLSRGSVYWRTQKRTTAGGPSGATDT